MRPPSAPHAMKKCSKGLEFAALLWLALSGMNRTAVADQIWVSCKPVEAATYLERIHVKCASPIDSRFWYFAAPTTDARFAARVLSVIEGAQLGDKFLLVLIDPNDESGTAFGCLAAKSRRFAAITMVSSRSVGMRTATDLPITSSAV
jgi:hypothetical protein